MEQDNIDNRTKIFGYFTSIPVMLIGGLLTGWGFLIFGLAYAIIVWKTRNKNKLIRKSDLLGAVTDTWEEGESIMGHGASLYDIRKAYRGRKQARKEARKIFAKRNGIAPNNTTSKNNKASKPWWA